MIFARLPMLLLLIRPTRPVAVLQFAGVSFVVLGVLRLARLPASSVQPGEFRALHRTLGRSLLGAALGIALMFGVVLLF